MSPQNTRLRCLAKRFGFGSLFAAIVLLAASGCGIKMLDLAPAATPAANTSTSAVATTTPIVIPPFQATPTTPIPSGDGPPSPVATATAPGATATPIGGTGAGTTPTAAARFQAASVFDKANRTYEGRLMQAVKLNYLGAPIESAHETKLAEQSFGSFSNGFCSSQDTSLLWREDTKQIYVLLVRNRGLHMDECRDAWTVYADTWQPIDGNNEDLKAPEGSVIPRAGFGKVWRLNYYGKSPLGLGFPKTPERYTTGTVQRFENATAFYFHDAKAIYVLFHKFDYYTRGGAHTGSIWFQVD